MKSARMRRILCVSGLAAAILSLPYMPAKAAASDNAVQVRTTVTAVVPDGKRLPVISPEDVNVKQGKARLRVTEWVPARGSRAALDLFVLIDDASDARLASRLDDLRDFIHRQPASTSIGIGYMRDATVQVTQQLTGDHVQAANALRLPMGTAGAYGSPYLSVMDLMKRWPVSSHRREIIMITDGIDRAGRNWSHPRRGLHLNADADTASSVAQRTGTVIYTLYTPGTGRGHRNYWTATSAQNDMTRLSEKTGGESYGLGLGSPVNYRTYLDRLETALNNQYLLSFNAAQEEKPGLRTISLNTELAGVRLAAPHAVWVPGLQEAGNQ